MNSAGVSFETNGKAWDIGTHKPFAGDFTQPLEVFGPSAGGALYSSEMLREIGLFDSSFFAYFEDLDLAWRARLRGWRCVYCPTAVVHHSHGGTAKPLSPFVLYQCQRNRLVVMARYYPVRYLALAAPRIIGEFAAGLLEKIKKGSSPSYDGLLSGFRQFMSSVNGRKSFIESAVINPASLIRAYGKREKYHILRNDVTPESVEKHVTSPVN